MYSMYSTVLYCSVLFSAVQYVQYVQYVHYCTVCTVLFGTVQYVHGNAH